jgi:hypothetical protein
VAAFFCGSDAGANDLARAVLHALYHDVRPLARAVDSGAPGIKKIEQTALCKIFETFMRFETLIPWTNYRSGVLAASIRS